MTFPTSQTPPSTKRTEATLPSADTLLSVARGQIGYSRWDDPEQGSKYGRWYAEKFGPAWLAGNGVPYCAMFVSYVFDHAGVKCAGLEDTYCPNIHNKAVAADDDYSARNAKPGDVVLFDWGHDGEDDHVGIVEENTGSYLVTIEGNTSNGSSGSQSNGGRVARRTRSYGVCTIAVRPSFAADAQWKTSEDGKKWWYDHGDRSYAVGWEKINGEWFFFDDNGWMVVGWLQRGSRWYYLNEKHDGHYGAMLTGWLKVGGKYYYADGSGALVSGWQLIGEKWYRFNEKHDGTWGAMLTCWTKSGGYWYWLWPDGHMGAGEIIRTEGKAYMLDAEGRVVTDKDVTVHFDASGAAVL